MEGKLCISHLVHLIISIILIMIFTCFIPSCNYRQDRVFYVSNARSDLHTIQIMVERYHTDHGNYPPYLLGGDKEGWELYNANRDEGMPYLSDPLIEGGYFDSYPQNVYFKYDAGINRRGRDGKALKDFLHKIDGSDGHGFDPRFGLNGDKMGNVLLEPYILVEQRDKKLKGYPRMCPGQFYYKAFGEVSTYEGFDLSEIRTPDDYEYQEHTYYVLGVFGSVNEPGQDTIRWTDMAGGTPQGFPYESSIDKYRIPEDLNISINLQLPEIIGSGNSKKAPMWPPTGYLNIGNELYRVAGTEKALPGWKYKCPDGVPDGIILILVTGSEKDNAGL